MMTDLYYLIPVGVLAGTNGLSLWRWRRALKRCDELIANVDEWGNLCSLANDRALRNLVRAHRAEEALTSIMNKRSAATAKGNHTRALKAQALRDATTAQLAGEVRAKVRKLRVAA